MLGLKWKMMWRQKVVPINFITSCEWMRKKSLILYLGLALSLSRSLFFPLSPSPSSCSHSLNYYLLKFFFGWAVDYRIYVLAWVGCKMCVMRKKRSYIMTMVWWQRWWRIEFTIKRTIIQIQIYQHKVSTEYVACDLWFRTNRKDNQQSISKIELYWCGLSRGYWWWWWWIRCRYFFLNSSTFIIIYFLSVVIICQKKKK